jgi:hypothetical protein
MDGGLPDWNLREEAQKLSPELLAESTEILLQRSTRKPADGAFRDALSSMA